MMTIGEAAEQVLKAAKKPMSASDVAKAIAETGLYTFGAKDPAGVVSQSLRKRIKAGSPIEKVGPNLFAIN